MPDNLEPSDAELEMVVDEARQKTGLPPAKRPVDKGIADMQARIKLLTAQRMKLLERMGTEVFDDKRYAALFEVDKELRQARERLTDYQTQQGGHN